MRVALRLAAVFEGKTLRAHVQVLRQATPVLERNIDVAIFAPRRTALPATLALETNAGMPERCAWAVCVLRHPKAANANDA